MKKIYSLKSKEHFNNVLNKGVKFKTTHLLIALQKANDFKIGYSVPKRLGNAVFRNLNKRRLKMLVPQIGLFENNVHIVVIVKEKFTKLKFDQMKAVLEVDLPNAIKYLNNGKK